MNLKPLGDRLIVEPLEEEQTTIGGIVLPVAVQAILFDLMNGGEKDWLKHPATHRPPYWDLGRAAALAGGAGVSVPWLRARLVRSATPGSRWRFLTKIR